MEPVMESITPTLEDSITRFAARVAEGKATPEELAFMTKVAKPESVSVSLTKEDAVNAVCCSPATGL